MLDHQRNQICDDEPGDEGVDLLGQSAFAIDIEERREHACAHDRDCLHNTPPRSG